MPLPDLTSNAIGETSTVADAQGLLAEWLLAVWFNGQSKKLSPAAADPTAWPDLTGGKAWPDVSKAHVRFDMSPERIQRAPEIRMILIPSTGSTMNDNRRGSKLLEGDYTLQAWVTAQLDDGTSEEAVALVSQLLVALLRNPGSAGQLGVKGLRVLGVRDAQPVEQTGPAARLVTARVRLTWRVGYEEPV